MKIPRTRVIPLRPWRLVSAYPIFRKGTYEVELDVVEMYDGWSPLNVISKDGKYYIQFRI